MSGQQQIENRPSHRKLVRKLVLLAVGMFGFGFAMWPLYGVFCDLTGLGGRGVKVVDSVLCIHKIGKIVVHNTRTVGLVSHVTNLVDQA